jgi:PAS domain S-box-containing protein
VEFFALIFAPHGRDAEVARALLKEAGVASAICTELAEFERSLDDRCWFAVVTEESLRTGDLRALAARIAAQPTWSDLPIIVLTQRGGGVERNPAAARLSEVLGNASFLERPFHPTTFVSLAKSAVRARQRQFDARTRIEQLREGEKSLQTALLAGRLGSWELDLETRHLTTTSTCKAIFGRKANEEFSYEELVASVHPDDRYGMQTAVRRSIETGADYASEYRMVWRDGSTHWAEVRARVVVGDHPDQRRMVGVSSDITDRKTAEGRLRKLNETLEERVVERTAELERAHQIVLGEIAQRERAEELLRQSQKMEMIGQLTGGIAHDFNNLLMAVLGNLELLRKNIPGDPRTERLIDGASQGAQRGAALTQRLLAFARKQDLQVRPTDIVALVKGMTALLERSIGSRVELFLDLPESLPPALIDSNQLELALLNLAVNARDAMPDGGSLSIKAEALSTPSREGLRSGVYIRLSIADTGQGMSPETLAKATEPFFSTKDVGKGTGLGLSMVQGLAVQLEGALRLSSEEGKGTVAELLLPATKLAATKQDEDGPATIEGQSKPRMTILVVDDDVLIAMSTVDMLEDLGHDVIEANSGERALEILGNGQSLDLMITDYSMPKMTGAQLAEKARELRPGMPILLATGYAELPAGTEMNLPRLSKPYRQAQLAAEIIKAVKTRAT